MAETVRFQTKRANVNLATVNPQMDTSIQVTINNGGSNKVLAERSQWIGLLLIPNKYAYLLCVNPCASTGAKGRTYAY